MHGSAFVGKERCEPYFVDARLDAYLFCAEEVVVVLGFAFVGLYHFHHCYEVCVRLYCAGEVVCYGSVGNNHVGVEKALSLPALECCRGKSEGVGAVAVVGEVGVGELRPAA